jgi:hypothetical protein
MEVVAGKDPLEQHRYGRRVGQFANATATLWTRLAEWRSIAATVSGPVGTRSDSSPRGVKHDPIQV